LIFNVGSFTNALFFMFSQTTIRTPNLVAVALRRRGGFKNTVTYDNQVKTEWKE